MVRCLTQIRESSVLAWGSLDEYAQLVAGEICEDRITAMWVAVAKNPVKEEEKVVVVVVVKEEEEELCHSTMMKRRGGLF